jgi:tetratricopeptide (TPR) repeat protein
LTYIQLHHLLSTIRGLTVDEKAFAQLHINPFAPQNKETSGETELTQIASIQPTMYTILKSVLKLPQEELYELGLAAKNRLLDMPSPFPKPDPGSQSYGIVYSRREVFPDETFDTVVKPPEEIPEVFMEINRLAHQSFEALRGNNSEEANQLFAEAVALAEQNNYPTFALKIRWESSSGRDENRLVELFQEAVDFYRTQNDRFGLAQKLRDLAFLLARIENRPKALECLDEAEGIMQSMTPEELSQTHHPRALLQHLIENEIHIHTRISDLQRLRNQIQSGNEVRGGYSISHSMYG